MVRSWMRGALVGLPLLGASCSAHAAPEPAKQEAAASALTKGAINDATFREPEAEADKPKGKSKRPEKDAEAKRPDPLLIKVQVLLDRARFSPGAIDGRDGENLRGALRAYAAAQGLPAEGKLTRALFDKLQGTSPDPVVSDYAITDTDVKGPFVEKMPPKMEEQADVGPMRYTNIREMLSERFHMQRDLLSALNPGVPLDKAGGSLIVAAVPPTGDGKVEGAPLAPKVSRIEVDKKTKRVRAYGEDGTLTADYPASIGSSEKPAPDGTAKVKAVAFDPWYTYNPKYRFKGVKTRKKFSIHPGPNNPVGLVWIDLSIESYGIHGTPEPEKIGKTESHGCIRLTNWDARDLASHTVKGAKVEFLDK
ncbi:hypothetical protein ASG52_02235 [Methylobacterium sp. Leaf456]|uniref:L,D-transpeptidase family protein n=1 Tax=Methylobacterium sp. Leaf456 TaxID=1736382 RepID=UPI0006F9C2A5|nr:L,D-transpeptidase [Methylobacterium sp. Leaf456]KQT56920.1 hypothetical protein ASG52_02235 [Methylobacterium sp. Leaf456]